MGGNVKVSEWPIQCAAASGQTGPRDLSLCLFGTLAILAAASSSRKQRKRRNTEPETDRDREIESLLRETPGVPEKPVGRMGRVEVRAQIIAKRRLVDSSRQERGTLSKEVLVSARVKEKAAKFCPLTCPFRAKTMEALV